MAHIVALADLGGCTGAMAFEALENQPVAEIEMLGFKDLIFREKV